jgi:hypothetical protein
MVRARLREGGGTSIDVQTVVGFAGQGRKGERIKKIDVVKMPPAW